MEMQNNEKSFAAIEEALQVLQKGNPVIIVDDEERENEGDLVYAAEHITEEKISFMLKHTSGIICAPCFPDRLEQLNIPLMVPVNTSRHGCAFTVSVDAKCAGTGVSAADRAQTIKTLADPKSIPPDLVRPGHIFPLRTERGGVLKRAGHTEAAADLCKIAGLEPIAVLAELMNPDGTMMRLPALKEFAAKHAILLIRIADLIAWRLQREHLIVREDAIHLPTEFGEFSLIPYQNTMSGEVHLAIMKGNVAGKENVLVRVHSECLTGDVFGSERCDCGKQLAGALQMIEKEGIGVVLYMRQEGRGIGLFNKLKAYHLQEKGFDTVEANQMLGYPADLRDYGIGAQILKDLGITSFRLLTNNPKKIIGLEGYGLKLAGRVPLEISATAHNASYLATKKTKLGHLLNNA